MGGAGKTRRQKERRGEGRGGEDGYRTMIQSFQRPLFLS